MKPPRLLLTCEHGGNRVPAAYRATLRGAARALGSHRGHDPGSLDLARQLARAFDAPLHACTVTRLLIDPNRSLGHPQLWSEWSRRLDAADRERVVERYWRPHRDAVDASIAALHRARVPVAHVSVHSFTPIWNGEPRDVDVGLLYDPSRAFERAFVALWKAELARRLPDLRVRKNQPYRGTADGLTKTLRAVHRDRTYAGVELEVSQRFPLGPDQRWREVRRAVAAALDATLVGLAADA